MWKKIIYSTFTVLCLGYLIFNIVYITSQTDEEICKKMEIEVEKSDKVAYLNELRVRNFLKNAELDCVGKAMSEIKIKTIKQTLEKNKLIKVATVYKTLGGSIKIKVQQRIPILRVISGHSNYFMDIEKEIMPAPKGFCAYVALASGNIGERYAKEQLYPLAVFLQKDEFWNAQIEQIYVNSSSEIELIPRVGNHRIILGKIKDFENKLDNLKLFYEKTLNVIGWNRYSTINLKYKNQIVCTKAD